MPWGYKAIIEAYMVSTPEVLTDKSPLSPGPSVIVKNTSARKSLCQFSEVLDVKQKTAICGLSADKLRFKYIIEGSKLCSSIQNRQ